MSLLLHRAWSTVPPSCPLTLDPRPVLGTESGAWARGKTYCSSPGSNRVQRLLLVGTEANITGRRVTDPSAPGPPLPTHSSQPGGRCLLFGVLQFLESPPEGVPTASGLGWARQVGIGGGAGCSPGAPHTGDSLPTQVRANRSQPQPHKSRMAPPTTWASPEAAAVLLPWSPALLSGWQGLDAVGEPTPPGYSPSP